ncbi:MAG: hypothetical protein NWF05_00630 [Candidatus Bathyarchaeota archaeon]|nr:hypothetical protein [Candidatus Bathyarchaeota archaeon]
MKPMHRAIAVYGRKIFSVALIFNALLTITCAVGILSGFYRVYPQWEPFAPYLADGNIYWLAIAAAIINIFPAAYVGKVHTGRLWFHHYVYGFFVLVASAAWLIFFTPISVLSVFFLSTPDVSVNAGKFFFLGGLTLVLDDLPDVHRVTFRSLRWLKQKAHAGRKLINATQFLLGFAPLYIALAVSLSVASNLNWLTPANLIQIGTLLITGLTCFASVKGKVWHKIDPKLEQP